MTIPSPMTRTAHTMKALAASSSKANTSAASAIAVAKIPSTQAAGAGMSAASARSEEHTSELQSQSNLVCRLLLEKKKKHLILQTELVILLFRHFRRLLLC